jgi:hypothetical protein
VRSVRIRWIGAARIAAAAGAVALGVAAAAAAGGGRERAVTTPGALAGIAADAGRLAYADGASSGDCGGVRVWTLRTRATPRLNGRRWCPSEVTSTGAGLVGPSLAGTRALWLSYAGGNIREWTLWTSVPGAPAPRAIRMVARDVDGPAPIVLGAGDQDVLPYGFDDQVIVMRANGARRFAWRAPARVAAVSAGGGRVAAVLAAGPVVVLSSAGLQVEEHAYAPRAVRDVRVSGTQLVVRTASGLDVWEDGERAQRALPVGAVLHDLVGGVVLYTRGGDVRALRTGDGRDVLLRATGARAPLAQLESGSGLFVGTGRRAAYALTWSQVLARLGAG